MKGLLNRHPTTDSPSNASLKETAMLNFEKIVSTARSMCYAILLAAAISAILSNLGT